MLRTAMGVGCTDQRKLALRRSTVQPLLALRGDGDVKFPDKNRYVTLQWPLCCTLHAHSSRYSNDAPVCIRMTVPSVNGVFRSILTACRFSMCSVHAVVCLIARCLLILQRRSSKNDGLYRMPCRWHRNSTCTLSQVYMLCLTGLCTLKQLV